MGILSVIKNQWKHFIVDKGMIFFYIISIIIVGLIAPYFMKNFQTSFTIIAVLTIMVSKPLISDSVASEREKKTLESVLSSPITIIEYLIGKVAFCMLFSSIFWLLCNIVFYIACNFFSISITSSRVVITEWFISIIIILLLVTVAGIYISSKSENIHIAQNKINVISYPLIIMLIIYFCVTNTNIIEAKIVINVIFYTIIVVLLVRNIRKLFQMNHSDFYEGIIKEEKNIEFLSSEKGLLLGYGDFMTVICHEFKYMKTLKTLNYSFLVNFIGPVAMLLVSNYFTGEYNIYFSVLTMNMMIPKIPTSYVAYSIGGEKAYKTGESLLSTPISLSSMILGKTVLPNIISAITIIVSTLLTLPVYSYVKNINAIVGLSASTWILMIPVSLLSSIIMTFLIAILSFILKTPRQAYLVTIFGGYIFMVPTAFILFVASNQLVWSLIYLAVLMISIFVLLFFVKYKINRPLLVSKL